MTGNLECQSGKSWGDVSLLDPVKSQSGVTPYLRATL